MMRYVEKLSGALRAVLQLTSSNAQVAFYHRTYSNTMEASQVEERLENTHRREVSLQSMTFQYAFKSHIM